MNHCPTFSGLRGIMLVPCLVAVSLPRSAAGEVGPIVARLKAADGGAARAWRELSQLGPAQVPAMLAALDGADAVAANWLQTAIDAVCENALARKQALPQAEVESFIRDRRHTGRARRLAYEWLVRVAAEAPARLLPDMLDDPDADLRRDAVARVVAEAERHLARGDKPQGEATFRRALAAACDRDQVEQIARQLRMLGATIDLAEHFGFVRDWALAGPFDNRGGAGFQTAFGPEAEVNLAAAYPGQGGAAVRWTAFHTADAYGLVDVNRALGAHKAAVAYAFAAVTSPHERPVQLRVGSDNAVKIFLNGKPVFAHEDYHVGTRMDQYVGRGVLRRGRNEILLKVCQNDGGPGWNQTWGFQLRVCDELGGRVSFRVTPSRPGPAPVEVKEKP
jgi:hypothetical protein